MAYSRVCRLMVRGWRWGKYSSRGGDVRGDRGGEGIDEITYMQVKECINEVGREGLEELLKDYGEKIIGTAFRCGISPRELQAVCRWIKE